MPITPVEALNRLMENRVADTRIRQAKFTANLLARRMPKVKRDTYINWDVVSGDRSTAIEAVTVDPTDGTSEDTVPASLRIGRYRVSHTFSVSRIALAEAASLAPTDIADLYGFHLEAAMNAIFRRLNLLFLNGMGLVADAEVGGLALMADNTKVYAGIDPATATYWQALTNTNATPRPFDRNLMLDFDTAMALNGETYDMVLMHPNMATKYQKIFDQLAGAASLPASDAGRGLKNADLGHGNRFYNGAPIIEEPSMPQDRIYLLDTGAIDTYFFDVASGPNRPKVADQITNTSFGLPMIITALPLNNPDMLRFNVRIHPQMRVFNRRAIKMIGNLS